MEITEQESGRYGERVREMGKTEGGSEDEERKIMEGIENRS